MDDGGRRWNIRVGRPEGVHATGQLRPFLWPASWLSDMDHLQHRCVHIIKTVCTVRLGSFECSTAAPARSDIRYGSCSEDIELTWT
jgi:hypothetical protein